MELALFDFDGTISTGESTDAFIKFALGEDKFNKGRLRLLPLFFLYLTGLMDHHDAKERYLAYYLKGMTVPDFLALSREFGETHLPAMVRKRAVEKIEWHKSRGHEVCVVSGSCEVWLEQWCRDMGIGLLGTRIDLSEKMITGKIAGRNCFSEEKAVRIRQSYILESYDKIYAYGDSRGDRAMFELADETFYRPFQ